MMFDAQKATTGHIRSEFMLQLTVASSFSTLVTLINLMHHASCSLVDLSQATGSKFVLQLTPVLTMILSIYIQSSNVY